jgi:hypothetical protein
LVVGQVARRHGVQRGRRGRQNRVLSLAKYMCETKSFCNMFRTALGAAA